MKNFSFYSKKRVVFSLIFSTVLVFGAMNFISRNINILATRSLPRIIIDYLLNIAIFFVIFYLVITVVTLIYKKIIGK